MKRHPALASLSRDHHHALVLALTLRRATEATAAEAAEAVLAHWETEERHHFRIEEEVLLPAYAEHGDPGHPAIARMLQDHIRIRRDVNRVIRGSPSLELLHQLGIALTDHVRLEEEELFSLVEATMPESDILALGRRLEDAE